MGFVEQPVSTVGSFAPASIRFPSARPALDTLFTRHTHAACDWIIADRNRWARSRDRLEGWGRCLGDLRAARAPLGCAQGLGGAEACGFGGGVEPRDHPDCQSGGGRGDQRVDGDHHRLVLAQRIDQGRDRSEQQPGHPAERGEQRGLGEELVVM